MHKSVFIIKVIYLGLPTQPVQFNQLDGSNFKMFTYRLNLIKFHYEITLELILKSRNQHNSENSDDYDM